MTGQDRYKVGAKYAHERRTSVPAHIIHSLITAPFVLYHTTKKAILFPKRCLESLTSKTIKGIIKTTIPGSDDDFD